jgi:hypothetical protein
MIIHHIHYTSLYPRFLKTIKACNFPLCKKRRLFKNNFSKTIKILTELSRLIVFVNYYLINILTCTTPVFEIELWYTSRGHTTYAYALKQKYDRMLMGRDFNYFHYHNHAITLPNEIPRQRYVDPEWTNMI